jgi:hypothetical protein
MPTYDKLWLQPLMFLSIMVTVVANEALERLTFRAGGRKHLY